jgi:hypothetical protein
MSLREEGRSAPWLRTLGRRYVPGFAVKPSARPFAIKVLILTGMFFQRKSGVL